MFFIVTANIPSGFTQWKKVNSGFSNDLFDVQTIGKFAFACGQNSKIIQSRDSGKTWKSLVLTIPANLRCLYFSDTLKGFVSGENARIQKTTDGGKTWSQKYIRTAAFAYDITFQGPFGLAVGKEMMVVSSDNDGENWSLDTTFKLSKQLNSVAISPGGICWAVGDSGVIIRKTLSLKKWTLVPSGTKINLTSVTCFDDSIVVICGGMPDTAQVGVHFNVYLISRDTGKTWEQSVIPEMKTILSAYFITPDTGIMSGTNGIICKIYHPLYSRGQQISGTANALNRITYADGYGLVVGDGGTILRTINFGGNGLSVYNTHSNFPEVFPNPCFDFLEIQNENKISEIRCVYADGKCENLNFQNQKIDVSELPPGIYVLYIVTENGVFTLKIAKH